MKCKVSENNFVQSVGDLNFLDYIITHDHAIYAQFKRAPLSKKCSLFSEIDLCLFSLPALNCLMTMYIL